MTLYHPLRINWNWFHLGGSCKGLRGMNVLIRLSLFLVNGGRYFVRSATTHRNKLNIIDQTIKVIPWIKVVNVFGSFSLKTSQNWE